MNIFYLDKSPKLAAQYHCDKHVVKMILETAQLLSTAHRVLDGETNPTLTIGDWREELLYKASHVNHPCAKWCRESKANYYWLEDLFAQLCIEYTRRYNKIHLCEAKFADVFTFTPDNINKSIEFTEPPQCMPDYCKVPGDTVQAYRNYYINEKSNFAVWKHSVTPNWYSSKEKSNV